MNIKVCVVVVVILAVATIVVIATKQKETPILKSHSKGKISHKDYEKIHHYDFPTNEETRMMYFRKYYPNYTGDGRLDYGLYDVFFPMLEGETNALTWGLIGGATNEIYNFNVYQAMIDVENNLAALRAGLPGQDEPLGFTYMFEGVGDNFDKKVKFIVNFREPIFTLENIYIAPMNDAFTLMLKQ